MGDINLHGVLRAPKEWMSIDDPAHHAALSSVCIEASDRIYELEADKLKLSAEVSESYAMSMKLCDRVAALEVENKLLSVNVDSALDAESKALNAVERYRSKFLLLKTGLYTPTQEGE